MNKSDKLRLYGQKDYTELIEFPVELVGKDGVVRRYTYEESLLVYAKRIESAHLRYRDSDVADAEVDHCYKRIEQIKRSWKHVSNRRVSSSADYAVRYEESAAAECRSFIREYFGKALADRIAPDEEPIPIYLSLIQQTGPLKVFHVSLANRKGTHLLYAFTFAWEAGEGELDARAQFADWSRILASNPDSGDDVERLLAAREGKEFGFLLTGPSAASLPNPLAETDEPSIGIELPPPRPPRPGAGAARARVQALLDEDPGNAEAHFAMGQLTASEGDLTAALEQFKACVELQPWYKDAYRRIAVIGDSLAAHDEVEPYLLQASHYFPDDDRLQFHLALLWTRQGRFEDARKAANRALTLEPANRQARRLLDLLDKSKRRGSDPRAALAEWKVPLSEAGRKNRMHRLLHAVSVGLLVVFGLLGSSPVSASELHSPLPLAGGLAFSALLVALMLGESRVAAGRPIPPVS